jgi:hypothetical protein
LRARFFYCGFSRCRELRGLSFHAPTRTRQLTADLAAAKENLAKLYARREELEAIKAAVERPG